MEYGNFIREKASGDMRLVFKNSSNGWAGTTCTLATMIWELLQEVKRLRKEQ